VDASLTNAGAISGESDLVRDLKAELVDLAAGTLRRPVRSGMVVTLMIAGLGLAFAGWAWSALLIVTAVGVSGWVDRRLPLLLAALAAPGLTAFDGLQALQIGGSVLDFRLLLTGGLAGALGCWALMTRPRIDAVAAALIAFVVIQIVMIPLSHYDKAQGLPPVARSLTWVFAYLLARSTLGTKTGVVLLVAFIATGMVVPAASGIPQIVSGSGLDLNGATRVAGLYDWPVGMALAMQIAALLVFGVVAYHRPIRRPAMAAAGLFAVFSYVLIETNTRLVFASFFAGLAAIEVLRSRPRNLIFIGAAALLILAVQPELTGRFLATGAPEQSPAIAAAQTPTVTPEQSPAIAAAQTPTVTPPPDDNGVSSGDASLRFRINIWTDLLRDWAHSPLIGRGTGSVPLIIAAAGGPLGVAAHNDYIGVLTENGIVGLTLFGLAQLAAMLALLRRIRTPDLRSRDLAITVLVLIVAMDVINVLNNADLYLDLQIICWGVCGATIAAVAPTALPEALARLLRRLPGSTRLLPELTTAESGEKG
jgi:hypothetical protein